MSDRTESPAGVELRITSAAGYLVAFDPEPLRARVKDPRSWWERDPLGTGERRQAKVAMWPIGGRPREYRVRVGTGLTELEQGYARGSSAPAPLVTASDELFVGPVERLPGDGFGDRLPTIEGEGGLVPFSAGRWALTVHVLDWRPDDRFWTDDNEPTEDAPPDFVVVYADAAGDLADPPAEPQPLTEHLPKKKAQAKKTVVSGKTWRSKQARKPVVLEDEKKKRRGGGTRTKKKAPVVVKDLKPGEMGVGATVRHPRYGVGTVLFVRDGFPKAKVKFHDGEEKVPKDELTVLS